MKKRNEIIVLVVLTVVAALVWYFEQSKPTGVSGGDIFILNDNVIVVKNPSLPMDEIPRARRTDYTKTVRNIFSMVAPPPSAVVAKTDHPKVPDWVGPKPEVYTPPPPAQFPENLIFYGYGTVPRGSVRLAFLYDGETVYVVAEGETVLGRYRILRINNNNLVFEEIANGRQGTKNLEEQAGPPA